MTNEKSLLYGLVLAGGKSSRMGKDKSVMVYHDKPQLQVAYELLLPFCSGVFVSTRPGQELLSPCDRYSRIEDLLEFEGKGPLGGILSAMKKYPHASWLVLACDLPFITPDTIRYLLANRNTNAVATAYRSRFDGLPEPLCAVWEKDHFESIADFFAGGLHCPRKIMLQSRIGLLELQSARELDNVNRPDEAEQAMEILKKEKI